jgi:hypothetical protein
LSGDPNPPLVPDIDKIFREGREPTEEEWILWAKNFKPKKLPSRKNSNEQLLNTKRAKRRLVEKEVKRKAYKNKENYLSWGRKYNLKRAYLHKYNVEWSENEKRTNQLVLYRQALKKYDSWIKKYKSTYKTKLEDYARTYKISDNEYVYGFTLNDLISIGPFGRKKFKSLLEDTVIPEPIYEGYLFKKNRLAKVKSKFYLLTESKAFFDECEKNKRRVGYIDDNNDKKLYLKKKIWLAMLQMREEFNNDKQN